MRIHQDYRTRIMQKTIISIPRNYSMSLKFTAQPVITQDRLLMETSTFYQRIGPITISTFAETHLGFCPHLPTEEPLPPKMLTAIRSAFDQVESRRDLHSKIFSCQYCPTDSSDVAHDGRVTFTVWQDFGAEASPANPYWRSHIWAGKNGEYCGVKFPYEHVSVRSLFYSSANWLLAKSKHRNRLHSVLEYLRAIDTLQQQHHRHPKPTTPITHCWPRLR